MTRTEEYLNTRLASIGLTPETNKRTLYDAGKPKESPILGVNELEQAIYIPYCAPDGEIATYNRDGLTLPFMRLRYMKPKEYEDKVTGKKKTMRYSQPPKSGVFTYMTPGIVNRYRLSEKIKTLFIVEGEIKALSGDVLGLPIIGIGGIQNIKDKENNTIDEYIEQLVKRCRPDNVVLLFDADLLDVKYTEDKDLATRLQNFCAAVINFMEYMKPLDVDLYFSHIAVKYSETAKGLDDLIASLKPAQRKKLVDELNALITGRKDFVNCMALTPGIKYKLEKYFRLDSVSSFYEAYKETLQDRIFKWKGQSYYYNGEKVERDVASKARLYMLVGNVYYRKCFTFNEKTDKEYRFPILTLVPYNKEIVKQEVKDLSLIPKFQMFTNIPDNTSGYKRYKFYNYNGVDTTCYNRYNPVKHDLSEGDWSTIEKFLRHIFSATNTAGESLYEFGLDYIQHTFFRPMEKMPVLCLTSTERNTGKSTFLYFMREIFQDNAVVLDNERFAGRFTDHFVDKLVVGIEEGFVGEEKKTLKERIKNYATNDTVWVEPKGEKPYLIDNYMHLIICTNNETNFMQIDEGENRFAVIKVPTLTEDDPMIMAKMKKEMGHFLYYLQSRKYYYPYDQSRFGFNTKVYETEGLKRVQERTENKVNKEIKQFIAECFVNYENVLELYFTPKDLAQEINREGGFSISKTAISDYLRYDMNMVPSDKPIRYDYYEAYSVMGTGEIRYRKAGTKIGRAYKFNYEDFIKEE